MDAPLIRVTEIQGSVDERSLSESRVRARIDRLRLWVAEAAIPRAIPPGAPVKSVRFTPYGLHLEVDLSLTTVRAEVRVFPTVDGLLGVEIASVATDLIGVPTSLAAAAIREFLPGQPWLRQRSGARWDVDLPALAAGFGVELAPLAAVRTGPGGMELELSRDAKTAAAPPSASAPGEAFASPEPPPEIGRLALCPACEGILMGQPGTCPQCASAVRYCPECGAAAASTAEVCGSRARHPLPPAAP